MSSGWGGLNSIIEEAKKRKEREDEEKRSEQRSKLAAEEQKRRQEREARERPRTPQPRPQEPQKQPSAPASPYGSQPIDTGPSPISSSQDDDDDRGRTRRSNVIQPVNPWSPNGPTVTPRQMAPSLSDRARGEYDPPGRPMVPTAPRPMGQQPEPQEQNRWQPLSQWGQQPEPEGRSSRQRNGYAEPQPQFDLTPQQQQRRQDIYAPNQNNWFDQAREAVGGALEQGRDAAVDWWTQTPEAQYNQLAMDRRRDYEAPTLGQGITKGVQSGARTPLGVAGGALWGIGESMLNRFDPTREVIRRTGDVVQSVSELGMAGANQPIPGIGFSASEVLTPAVTLGRVPLEQPFRGAKETDVLSAMIAYTRQYMEQEVTKTQNLRKRVGAEVEAGNPQANLALRNLLSGAESVQQTLDLLVNRDGKAQQLEQQAVAIQKIDPVQAGQLFLGAQELRKMTNLEAVEANMNLLAEFAYGMIFDPTNVVGPLIGVVGLLPEAQKARQAGKLISVTPGEAIARLQATVRRGERLTGALTQGTKQAQQVYSEVIAPFQGMGERVTNVTWVAARTPESRAAMDTEQLWQGLTGVLSGLTNKSDVKTVLNTLLTAPDELVRGVGNLSQEAMQRMAGSDGLARWGAGLVGNNDFVRRVPILKTVQDELANMRSLGGEGMVNPYEFFAELHSTISDGARRLNGGKQPTRLPFGAANVEFRRLGPDSAVVDYVDGQGKMIQRSVEMGLTEAQRRVTEIQAALKPAGKGLLDYARIPADIQRAIMSDLWLGTRPANWIGNALGATTNLFANDSYTLLPNTRIQDYFSAKFGGGAANTRLFGIETGQDISRKAGQEVGSGAVDKLAQLITRNPDNDVSKTMRWLYDRPYGNTEIKLPGGLAIPFGEGAFYSRAFYVPFMRTFNAGVVESINTNLVPRLQQMEGMNPRLIQQVGDWVVSLAQNGGKSDVATGIRKLAGKPEFKMTLKQLGVPPELLSPQAARQIEQFIMDASPSQAGQVMQEISKIIQGERNPAASVLNLSPQQPGIYDWTDQDMTQEAAWLADSLLRDAKKAGLDPAQIQQQITDLATGYVQDQAATFERINSDLAGAPNTPDTWSIVMDFWQDVQASKLQARGIVDEAGKRASQLQTPEAWAEKWQTTRQTYEDLRQQLGQLGEQSRTALQDVYNGKPYQPKHDWWETIEGYLGWDEQAFREARAVELGSPDAADAKLWQQVITANREYIDNSIYELFGAFQRYPSIENFDIVRNGMQKLEYMGAQVRANLDVLLDRLVAGQMSKTAYARARNQAWNTYFDAGVEYNGHLGNAIVRNGLLESTASGLKWTEPGGATWQLQGPSETSGKWWARNVQSGAREEFSLAETAGEAGPFVVPKDVVNDYNRLAKNEKAIDAAADEVMKEIADGAPEPIMKDEGGRMKDEELPLPSSFIPPTSSLPSSTPPTGPLRPDLMELWPDEPITTPRQGRGGLGADIRDREAPPLRTTAKERRDAAAAAYEQGPEAVPADADIQFMPDVTTPQSTVTIPTNNELRAAANEAGIATATKDGRGSDRHLLAVLNARMGSSATRLDGLTDAQRLAARDVLAKHAVEAAAAPLDKRLTKKAMLEQYGEQLRAQGLTDAQLSKMSKAEVAKAIENPAAPTATALDFGEPGVFYRGAVPGSEKRIDEVFEAGRGKLWVARQEKSARMYGEEIETIRANPGAKIAYEKSPDFALLRKGYKRNVDLGQQLRKGETIISAVNDAIRKADELGYDAISFSRDSDIGTVIINDGAFIRATKPSTVGAGNAVAKSKQFAKMSAPEIVDAVQDELRVAGFSDAEVADLAKQPRRSVLDFVESIRGEVPDDPNMRTYEYSVPDVAQLLGFEPAEQEMGKTIREWISRTRRTGNNTAPQMADVAQVQIKGLTDLERTLRQRLPEILQGTPNELNGAQRLGVVDAVLDWLPEFDNVLTKAQRVGDRMAGQMMLNYNDRRNFDTILGLLTPYHYFWSRMPSRVLMGALSKPQLVNFYYESKRAIALENEQADVPDRLKGTLPIPGTNARLNVSKLIDYAIPAQGYMQPNPFVEEDPTDNMAEQWAKQYGKWGPGLFQTNQLMLDLLDGKIDKDYSAVLNDLMPIQPSSIFQAATGQMPQGGNPWNVGFGPSEFDDYRARRAVSYIGVEEKLPEDIVKYANQVIVNQHAGDPVEKDIPPASLKQALALAERGVKRAAEDKLAGRGAAFTTSMSVAPYTEAEKAMRQAQGGYFASAYDPATNPQGSKELQRNIIEQGPDLPNWWAKSSETPGIDGQISALYDEAYATGDWDRINPQIEALKAQKEKIEAGGRPVPAMGPSLVPGQGPAQPGLNTKGMNPEEVATAEQKAAASAHWDAYFKLEDNAAKAKYLRDNPDFAEIYKQNIVDKGEEPEDWWTDYGAGGAGGSSAWSTNWDEYQALGEDYASKKQYMLDNPEFADYYVKRYGKDSAWWLDEDGAGGSAQWSLNWDEYQALGENWDAKKQYMLDNPAFAKYYKDRYGSAWWESRTGGGFGGGYSFRSYGGGGGGGRRGGGEYTPPTYPPNIYAREMDRNLEDWRWQQRWWPQAVDGTMDWQRAGDRVGPDPIKKWQPPRM